MPEWLNVALHSFGVWYFNIGWLIATVLGCFAGPITTHSKHPGRNLALWCAFVVVIGTIAFYGKHGIKVVSHA